MSDHPHDDERFMRRAIALSYQGMRSGEGGPFGAVVVQDGRIVGEGRNQVLAHNDPTAHAEVQAIRDATTRLGDFSLAGCVLYTSCEPCPMCLAATYWARIDRIVFGASAADAAAAEFDDSQIYEEIARPKEARSLPMRQSLQQEAVAAFVEWLRSETRTRY